MRIIVPYATLYPETRTALEDAGLTAEYVFVGGDPEAYYRLLTQAWADGRGFVNIEQDIVVRPDTVALLEACPELWCGFAYALAQGYGAYLGCARFSDRLVTEHPAVMHTIEQLPPDGTPRRYWGRLDTRLAQVLEQREGVTMHVHWPVVEHMNPKQIAPIVNCWRCGAPIPDTLLRAGPAPYPCACEGAS